MTKMLIKECIFKELEDDIVQMIERIVCVLCTHLVGEYITSGQWEAVIDEFLPTITKWSSHCMFDLDVLFDLVMTKLGPQRFTSLSNIPHLKERLEGVVNWVLQVIYDYETQLGDVTVRPALFRRILDKTPTFQRLNGIIQKRSLICGNYSLSRLSVLPIFQ